MVLELYGIKPYEERLEDEIKRLRAALIELKTLGEHGMGPDYEGWLTFHDKVAAVASAALSGSAQPPQA